MSWNPRLKSHIFVGEGFPLPFSLSMCAAQFMKPQVSIRESQDSIHAAGNSFLISHSSFIFRFQFSIIRNPPVTASPCHPPLGKEGFFRLPCLKGAPLQTVRDCFSFIFNFPLFLAKGAIAPLSHTPLVISFRKRNNIRKFIIERDLPISASFSASCPFVSVGFFLQRFMCVFCLTFGSLIIYSLCRYQNLCIVRDHCKKASP